MKIATTFLTVITFSMVSLGQIVNIPDPNFKAYLVGNTSINTNADSEIQESEAMAFTGRIFCPYSEIVDLTGIEAFVNILELDCGNNYLNALDVTHNTALTSLKCGSNSIDSLDLTQNINLTLVFCYSNYMRQLNVASGYNIYLRRLYAPENPTLACIQVDDVAWSIENWTEIDEKSFFNTNCNYNGVDALTVQNAISVFPNPVNSILNIETKGVLINSISFIDVTSKVVKEVYSSFNSIDTAELEKGVYFLRIQTSQGVITKKIIKE